MGVGGEKVMAGNLATTADHSVGLLSQSWA